MKISNTRAYYVWRGMKARCNNPAHLSYKNYGGRGIKVCDRWFSSFHDFIQDMGEPAPGMTLDRIDNDGNYEPGNVRWATRAEQANKKTTTRVVEWRGERMSFAEFVRRSGSTFCHNTLLSRLNAGWSPDEAISTAKFRKLKWSRPTNELLAEAGFYAQAAE